jgi:outer membrane protein assembly factor BamD (BamD/ComL family)
VAADAFYRAGIAYDKEALKAEYDQSTAGHAIATFADFTTLYPNDPRVPQIQKIVAGLKAEQARGSYQIAKFYEKHKHWNGALIYYNEVLLQDPASAYAKEAQQRIDELKKRTRPAGK